MIGCASISMADGGHVGRQPVGAAAADAPRADRVAACEPRLALPVDDLGSDLAVEPPPLIKGYLRCGARVLGAAGLGPRFQHRGPADDDAPRRPAGALPAALPRRLSGAARRAHRKGKRYSPSPNLSSISASSASIASCSSLAVGLDLDLAAHAGGQHHHAHDALGIDAPAAAAECRPRTWKLPASLVSLAEARACRPSLLLMVMVA